MGWIFSFTFYPYVFVRSTWSSRVFFIIIPDSLRLCIFFFLQQNDILIKRKLKVLKTNFIHTYIHKQACKIKKKKNRETKWLNPEMAQTGLFLNCFQFLRVNFYLRFYIVTYACKAWKKGPYTFVFHYNQGNGDTYTLQQTSLYINWVMYTSLAFRYASAVMHLVKRTIA